MSASGNPLTLAEIAALLVRAQEDAMQTAQVAASWGWGGDMQAADAWSAKAREYEAAARQIEALAEPKLRVRRLERIPFDIEDE